MTYKTASQLRNWWQWATLVKDFTAILILPWNVAVLSIGGTEGRRGTTSAQGDNIIDAIEGMGITYLIGVGKSEYCVIYDRKLVVPSLKYNADILLKQYSETNLINRWFQSYKNSCFFLEEL